MNHRLPVTHFIYSPTVGRICLVTIVNMNTNMKPSVVMSQDDLPPSLSLKKGRREVCQDSSHPSNTTAVHTMPSLWVLPGGQTL